MLDIEKIENLADCISGYDHSLKIRVWNKAVAKKYGITKEQAIDKNVHELFPHLGNDFRLKCLQQAIEIDQVYFFPSMPYVFERGLYTQLVLPEIWNNQPIALSIVRDHVANECFSKADLLGPLMVIPVNT